MRLLLTFIIFILGGFYTFGKENCCEQCCEYLENCCKKGEGNKKEENKEEVPEEFYLKKTKAADPEKIEKLVNPSWYGTKKETASFFLYEKIDNMEKLDLNNNDVIKVKKDKNGFSFEGNFIPENDNNEQKWALFEIIYKKEEEGKVEGEENKENEEVEGEENKENEEVEEKETVYLYCSNIESISDYSIFLECKQHVSISVIACDTSGVTNMFLIFSRCSSLTELDLSKFNTEKVTDMSLMFADCKSLKELDLSKFNTETVTNMSGMFLGCSSLTKLDLSKFNTETVTNMRCMFYDCSSLTKLDLSKFNTEKVTDMSSMFSGCSSLTKLDLSNFNTDNVTDMENMFFECSSLHTVTFNNNLNEGIKQQLNELGLTEEVEEEEENKITLKKNN